MHKILCFDTSNNVCSVAISSGKNLLYYEQDNTPSVQAESLLPMIERALKKTNLTYHDLDYLLTTTGPGSFTGIRIGLAAAQAIARATNVKALGVNAFDLALYRIKHQLCNYQNAIIVINALRGQQYIQVVEPNVSHEPILLDNAHAVELIKEYANNGLTACTGSGVAVLYQELKNAGNLVMLPRFAENNARLLARIASLHIDRPGLATSLEPLYIRPADAKRLRPALS